MGTRVSFCALRLFTTSHKGSKKAKTHEFTLDNAVNVKYVNVVNVKEINIALSQGKIEQSGVFPHLEELQQLPVTFELDFGLSKLPDQPGILCVRGPRQFGKSTWLESQVYETTKSYGPGSAFYLNGDEMLNHQELVQVVNELSLLYSTKAKVKRLFIDEITAIDRWEKGIKRLIDSGIARKLLIITTGSKATDLRRGHERLPGRKGKLNRTEYYFAPISYPEFKRVCFGKMGKKTLTNYLISGGSPPACVELYSQGKLPEYVIHTVRDWILGEIAASGRTRSSLMAILQNIIRYGGTPIGHAKLARESGLANNTVATGYTELLCDLMCITTSRAWDNSKQTAVLRKPSKFHFINLLAVVAWHPQRIRSAADFEQLSPQQQGIWYEWAVAQELVRQASIMGREFPETLYYWQSKHNEIDFVTRDLHFIEIKRGPASPIDFSWFSQSFPQEKLVVISQTRFTTSAIDGITLEEFLTNGKSRPSD